MKKTAKRLVWTVLSVLMILSVFSCLSLVTFAAQENDLSTANSINFRSFTETYEKSSAKDPSCIIKTFALNFVKGQKVDVQLLTFADQGYTHSIKVLDIPSGLKLSQNGRLTGTVNLDYSNYSPSGSLSFDVRWKGSDVHAYYESVYIYVHKKSDTVKIPTGAATIDYNKAVSVSASNSNPKWYKFRARSYGFWVTSKAVKPVNEYSNAMAYEIYDSQGIPVIADGYGDGADGFSGGGYYFTRGDYYYIKATSSGKLKLNMDSWMPTWTSDIIENEAQDAVKLTRTDYKKTFSGDGTLLWNVYSIKATLNADFKNGFIWTDCGTMRRFASPVNIYMQTTAKSNADMIGYETFKYDPNNAKECEAIGASTKQDTLKKELLKGEKEYRFDTVYYLMPKTGKLTIEESSLLYVPSCYKLDAKQVHIVKRSGHSSTQKVTKATTSKDGKVVYYCNACKADVKTQTIAKVTSFRLTATQYTYDGKAKTPGVVVKDSKGKTLKNGTDYTVKYASGRTNTGKYAVVITLKGNYSGSKTLYFNIVPGVTGNIAVGQTTSLIKISWEAVPGASGYRVYRYDTNTKKYTPLADTKKTSYIINNLKPATVCKIAVKAYKTVGNETLWSESSKAVATATKPDAPTLTATGGTGSAVLKWTKQSGATGYVVYMSQTQDGTYKRIANLKGDSSLTCTKKGLTAGTTYYFKVQAYKIVSDTVIYGLDSAVQSVEVK
ncbi:MAG: fibronectin type III domain-containing protein [Acutalibacteraceae bacterium]